MDEPRITNTATVQSVQSDLSSEGEIAAAEIVRKILQRHPEYASGTAREVASGALPEFDKKRTAEQWLNLVRSMFDPMLVDHLHGRLAILGLCRLDEGLGDYLRSFVAELQKELLEDFDSLLLPEYAGDQKYCREFLKILQNQAKLRPEPDKEYPPRDVGFLILTRGGRSLDNLTRLCFQQRYNTCFTAHYKLSSGRNAWDDDTWKEFEHYLLTDLKGIVAENYGTIGAFLPELGVNLRPGTSQRSWRQIALLNSSPAEIPGAASDLQGLLTHWGSMGLSAGQRVVLFIEWQGVPESATRSSLGMTDAVLLMLQKLPERVGIVMSGLPKSVTDEIRGEYVHFLTLPEDKVPMLSQTLLNDTPAGPDRLKIVDEVQALADAIALKEMNPPLVIGIFGGWGSGKSFVLHLIEERLQELRCQGIGDGDNATQNFPFVGHPYLIRFDAWTFAKSNLWASLMQTTLVELDRQLSLEHELAQQLNLDLKEKSDVWRLLGELTDKQRDRLLKTELGKRAIQKAADFAKRGSPGCLWGELEKLRHEEKKHLTTEEDNLRELRVQQSAAQRELEAEVNMELSADASKTAWMPVWQEIADLVRDEFDESGARTFNEVIGSVPFFKKFWLGLTKLSLPAAAFMVLAIAGGFLVSYIDPLFEWWGRATGVVVAMTAPMLRAWDWFEKRRDAYEQRLAIAQASMDKQREERINERIRIADTNTPGAKVAALTAKVEDTEARVDRIRARLGVTGHSRSLNDFLKTRIEEGLYQKELGLLDQIQGDIQELSDTLLPSRARGTVEPDKLKELFPRGDPRVVLLIDDLDRCPPDKVVEVLEAAQLLVKTRLFVVVIAMDVRYVTRALEAQYENVLVRSGEPSGLDYIEKIIQIPYRVRTVSALAIRSFLRSQMEIVEPEEPATLDEQAVPPPTTSVGEDDTADEQAKKARLSTSARSSQAESTDLPQEVIQFEPNEYTAISAACSVLAVSPRTMKRLVNVFKLLKIIWHRQGKGKGPSMDVKQAMLSILALCARYPEVLRKILADMEAAYRAESSSGPQRLVDFMVERCKKGAEVALYPPDWHRVAEAIQRTQFFPENVTFSRLEEANLHLLSSFSFVGETDAEREATLQRGFYRNTMINAVGHSDDWKTPSSQPQDAAKEQVSRLRQNVQHALPFPKDHREASSQKINLHRSTTTRLPLGMDRA
jgi:predicted KAP-like P-loop ATPase